MIEKIVNTLFLLFIGATLSLSIFLIGILIYGLATGQFDRPQEACVNNVKYLVGSHGTYTIERDINDKLIGCNK